MPDAFIISISHAEDKIKIKFDSIYFADHHREPYQNLPYELITRTMKHIYKNTFSRTGNAPQEKDYNFSQSLNCLDKKYYDNQFNPVVTPAIILDDEHGTYFNDAVQNQKGKKYAKESVVYTFPADPSVALLWIACVVAFLNRARKDIDIFFYDESVEDFLLKKKLELPVADAEPTSVYTLINQYYSTLRYEGKYFEKNMREVALHLLKSLTEITLLEESQYKNTLAAVKAFYAKYNEDQSSFHFHFSPTLQKELLFKNQQSFFDNPPTLQELVDLGKQYSARNEASCYHYLLGLLELQNKQKLYKECIGKTADDGGQFTFNYTEWYFMALAKIKSFNDKQLTIEANKESNPAFFISNYHDNPKLLFKEMKVFVSAVGLSLSEHLTADNFTRDGFVFSEESSEKLKKLYNLAVNVSYVKTLAHIDMSYTLFYKKSPFNELPHEMIKHINAFRITPDGELNDAESAFFNKYSI